MYCGTRPNHHIVEVVFHIIIHILNDKKIHLTFYEKIERFKKRLVNLRGEGEVWSRTEKINYYYFIA